MRYLLPLILCFLSLHLCGQDYQLPANEDLIIETCSGTLYDSGGPDGDYVNDSGSAAYIQVPEGDYIEITFSEFAIENSFDFLAIVQGNSTNGQLIGFYTGDQLPNNGAPIIVPGQSATIYFESDFVITDAGFAMNFNCVTNDNPPIAAAGFPGTTCTGTVSFIDNSTNFPDSWLWDFGDGNTSTDQNPLHSYANDGTYNISLTVCNDNGCDTIDYTDAIVYDSSDFICSNGINVPAFGDTTTLACSGILFDSGGPNGDYTEGNFGYVTIAPPGATSIALTFTEFNLGNIEHTDGLFIYNPETFESYGNYVGVDLPNNGQPIVIDAPSVVIYFTSDHANNFSGFSMLWQANGSALPPVANISASTTNTPLNVPVYFMDESENGPGLWNWSFGDGNSSSEQNPTYTYSSPGTYEVTMTAENCNGSDVSETLIITVQEAPSISYNPSEYNITLEAGTTSSENLTICNIGLGDLLLDMNSEANGSGFGYHFEFTTNENGPDLFWRLMDENLQILQESNTTFEPNQTYPIHISGLDQNALYYFSIATTNGTQAIDNFIWYDTQTGMAVYEGPIDTTVETPFFLPHPTGGNSNFIPWLSAAASGELLSSDACNDYTVTFDATDLNAGIYEGQIIINSNDPNNPQIIIPVTLTVTGTPSIAVSANDLDFGAIQVGASSTLSFTIENDGTDELSVAGLASDEIAFVVNGDPAFNLAPGETRDIEVVFTPTAIQSYTELISIENNATTNIDVNLTGSGVAAPSLTVDPTEFTVELIAGQDTNLFVNLGNIGEADLNYSIAPFSDLTGFQFNFTTDQWGGEFYWDLVDGQGQSVNSSNGEFYEAFTDYSISFTGLSTTETYTLNMFDSFGDGALSNYSLTDLGSGTLLFEGAFQAPDNPFILSLDLGSPNEGFLEVSPLSGTVNINGSQVLDIFVETTNLSTGVYNLTVTLQTNDPLQPTVDIAITLYVIAPVVTDFSAGTTFVCGNEAVQFTDETTNTPSSWLWDFGDGNSSTAENPSHLYSADGSYTVSLTTCNALGCDTNVKTDYIAVELDCYNNSIPLHGFQDTITVCEGTIYDSGGANGDYFEGSFGGLIIAPPGATLVSLTFTEFDYQENVDYIYVYDGLPYVAGTLLGQFTGDELVGQTLVASTGIMTILEQTDHYTNASGFAADFSCSTEPQAPSSNFTYGTYNAVLCANEPVIFSDLSVGPPNTWLWDFGDGITSNEQNPVHLYAASGSYQVLLTTCNDIGCDTYISMVDVEVDPDCIVNTIPNNFNTTAITGCNGTLYDSGGPNGNSMNYNVGILTLISQSNSLAINFTSFDFVEGQYLAIYDGLDFNSPLIGEYTGTDLPEGGATIFASGNTFSFYEYTVNGSPTTGAGFSMDYSCEQTLNNDGANLMVFNDEICDGILDFQTPEDMLVDSWSWDFGDGTTSTEATPSHEFPAQGLYDVSLEACYQGNCETYVVTVHSNKITPEIQAPAVVAIGEEVHLHGLTENTTHWNWDFGNGAESDDIAPTTSYDTPGEYDIHVHLINMNIHEICDATHIHKITVNETGTSSNNNVNTTEVNVYPNPIRDVLNIEMETLNNEEVELRILAIDGRLVRSQAFEAQLDVSELRAGAYVLEVAIDGEVSHRFKLMKVE